MNNLNDLDSQQRDFARALRSRLRIEQPIDAEAAATLASARRKAVAAIHKPRDVWRYGLDGLAIASVLVVLALIAPSGQWQHGSAPATLDAVEAASEDLAPEFGDDLELLQWLAPEQDPHV